MDEVDRALIDQACGALARATGLTVSAVPHSPLPFAAAEVTIADSHHGWQLLAFPQRSLKDETLAALRIAFATTERSGLCVTRHVTPSMAKQLRQSGIHYLDLAGNAFIRTNGLCIDIHGHKPAASLPHRPQERAFQQSGLQLLFFLLREPEFANAPYREQAERAGVSLGTVHEVYRSLKQREFLAQTKRHGRRMIRTWSLYHRWLAGYSEILRPKMSLGRFRIEGPDWWRNADWSDAQLSGEAAAAEKIGVIRPDTASVYVHGDANPIIQANRLRRDPRGNVELLAAFWPSVAGDDRRYAPSILIYADLMTGDERAQEAAQALLEHDDNLSRLKAGG